MLLDTQLKTQSPVLGTKQTGTAQGTCLCPRAFSRCSNASIDSVKGAPTPTTVSSHSPALWQSIFATSRVRWKVPSYQSLRGVGPNQVQSNQKAFSISFPGIISLFDPIVPCLKADTIEGDLPVSWEAISGAAQVWARCVSQ